MTDKPVKIRIASVDSDPYLVNDPDSDSATSDVAIVVQATFRDPESLGTKLFRGQAVLVVTQEIAHELGHVYLHGK